MSRQDGFYRTQSINPRQEGINLSDSLSFCPSMPELSFHHSFGLVSSSFLPPFFSSFLFSFLCTYILSFTSSPHIPPPFMSAFVVSLTNCPAYLLLPLKSSDRCAVNCRIKYNLNKNINKKEAGKKKKLTIKASKKKIILVHSLFRPSSLLHLN